MAPYGYSIFCDDIRNEVGGKLSFIGCYNAVMFVPRAFPYVLPKFCVHAHVVSPAGLLLHSVSMRCYAPGRTEPVINGEVALPEVSEQRRLVEELDQHISAPRYITASASLILSPFELLDAGLISVRAVINGASDELRLGSLRVVVAE